MTSTSFNVGLRDGQRLSSRVLRPPGGGHTQLFGESDELQNSKNQEEPIPETVAETQQEEQPNTEVNGAPESEIKQDKVEEQPDPVEKVKEEREVAPEPAPEAAPAPRLQVTQRRTRVPPGGYSSGLW